MESKTLWQISITTSAEAEEPIVELAQEVFGLSPSVYHSEEKGGTLVSLFSPCKISKASPRFSSLANGLQKIQQCGLDIGPGKIVLKRIKREDWAESWKKHFRPIELGAALLIKPSWSKRRPRRNQAVVILDPGLSFGTGQHPTTEFCLGQLVAARRLGTAQSFLDIGAGSGILAIAAAKIGYWPVEAFDSDAEAVRVARSNAERNGVLPQIHLVRRDLTRLRVEPRVKFDVICANLISELLLSERGRIVARLKQNATLILAGLLKTEFAKVRQHYEAAGLKLKAVETSREWKSGAFAQAVASPA